jgi:hypothetical protein
MPFMICFNEHTSLPEKELNAARYKLAQGFVLDREKAAAEKAAAEAAAEAKRLEEEQAAEAERARLAAIAQKEAEVCTITQHTSHHSHALKRTFDT